MKRLCFTFREEPQEQAYFDLIDYALISKRCKFAILIGFPGSSLNSSGKQALRALSPFLIESIEVSQWPGTKLLDQSTAQLYKYNFDSDFANQLKSLSHRLYQWQYPDLPEDLSLMIDDQLPWLFTIAHEKDAVICLEPTELKDLQNLPSVSSLLIEDKFYREDIES